MLSQKIELRRSSPESVGLSSESILRFIEGVEAADQELHSLMILKDQTVIAEGWWAPFQPNDLHLLYSLSKSFTSTAIGFAVQEGLVQLDDPVISYFPSQLPSEPSLNLQAMKIRDLLTMTAGHENDQSSDLSGRKDGDWVKGFLARPVVFQPGTHFLYNSSATYLLSAIITRVTGLTTLDYLRPRLLEPLGIEGATWETCPKGISVGGWGMSVTTDAIARFGQFLLQKGEWEGSQLLAAEWIEDATRYQVPNGEPSESDWTQGYGFQFWRCRHNSYRGDGAFGQYCVVIPDHNIVVAITSSVSDMGAILNLIWNHILPTEKAKTFPENPEALATLSYKLANLELPAPSGVVESTTANRVSGVDFRNTDDACRIVSCRYDFTSETCDLTIDTTTGVRTLSVGIGNWIASTATFETTDPKKIAAIGAWADEKTFTIKVRYLESPAGFLIKSTFDKNSVQFASTLSGRFGPSEGPSFTGLASSLASDQ